MKKAGRALLILVVLFAVAIIAWWYASAPPAHLIVAPAYEMSDPPESITQAWASDDIIGETVETIAGSVPGYDEIVLQEDRGRAFATAMDGWIWLVNLETGDAERFVDPPLMAAGARQLPGDPERICFCASFLYGAEYPAGEQVGLYELHLPTKEITPLVTRVPNPPPIEEPLLDNEGTVFTAENAPTLTTPEMNDENSRLLAFCNDLDISADGRRIYFSEPFPYEGASMGGGAIGEAITLGPNGRLWRYDRDADAVSLVAQNYNFVDGVLLEYDQPDGSPGPAPTADPDQPTTVSPASPPRETSVLISETTKFRILRFYLNGDRAGADEVLWDNLPAMADGLDRDLSGRIWVGMIKQRTPLISWAHGHPKIKPLMLRLPLEMLPVPESTGLLALSPDAATPLFYTAHDGSTIKDISVVVPGREHLYLPTFSPLTPGIHRMPYPEALSPNQPELAEPS